MKLVLAEKPSVAMSLSKVIGANQRRDGYMEGNGYLVSCCVGHLVELSQPEAYDEKYAKWRYDDLPILPEHWQYQVSASTKKQFGILKKLMQDLENNAEVWCVMLELVQEIGTKLRTHKWDTHVLFYRHRIFFFTVMRLFFDLPSVRFCIGCAEGETYVF